MDDRRDSHPEQSNHAATIDRDEGGVAVQTRPQPAKPETDRMPPWRVLLHNDDVNTFEDVVDTILELTRLSDMEAIERMLEAHLKGVSLLLMTHREHAELLHEQFTSKCLTVTIEPD
jgi:ATP-dependent Clp protease adaptor protein ClpS